MSTTSFTFAMNTTIAVTIAISLIGNLISIIIFSRKTFRNNSISTYCLALSIDEFFALFKFAENIGIIAFNVNLIDQSETICKVFSYIPAIYNAVQPCILVAFSVDKLLSMRISSIGIIKRKWFQWLVVAAIVMFNVLLYLELVILVKRREIVPGYIICDQTTIGFLPTLMIVIVLETCIIPFIIMIVSSILTVRLLIKSRNSVERVGNVATGRKSRDRKYAVSSVTFNILFLVFKTPSMIYYTLFAFYFYYDVYYLNIAIFLSYLNSALFFFIHLVTNSLFRREFLVLIGLVERNGDSSSNTNNRINALNRINQIS